MNTVQYELLKPEELIERIQECPIAYLPLGTLEWHGIHMPLGADGLQSQAFFEELANKIGGVVLPKLFLGPDGEEIENGIEYHGMERRSFKKGYYKHLIGSVYYMPEKQFQEMLDRIVENLHDMKFKIVVAHGHGPSVKAWAKMKETIKEKYNIDTYNCWELGYDGIDGFMNDHAAANETSITMGFYPELVNLESQKDKEILLGMRGRNPLIYSSYEDGRRIIDMNLDKVSTFLLKELETIEKPEISISYNHALDLISKD